MPICTFFEAISTLVVAGVSSYLTGVFRVPFQTSDFMLITMGLMILAGNTCYPVFLRLIIWMHFNLLPDNEKFLEHRTTLRFLLDHPRRCYTNLFPSRHTWWLLATLIVLNGTGMCISKQFFLINTIFFFEVQDEVWK